MGLRGKVFRETKREAKQAGVPSSSGVKDMHETPQVVVAAPKPIQTVNDKGPTDEGKELNTPSSPVAQKGKEQLAEGLTVGEAPDNPVLVDKPTVGLEDIDEEKGDEESDEDESDRA